jgi:DNA polymerase III alpha subunit
MYSALDAVPTPEEWLEWALKNGCPGLAITDHGTAISMYHATRFPDLIKQYNKSNKTEYATDAVVGIPGVELFVKLKDGDKEHYHMLGYLHQGVPQLNEAVFVGLQRHSKVFRFS